MKITAPTIVMVTPQFYDVQYKINPYMDPENKVDKIKAHAQWEKLKQTYQQLGLDVVEVPGVEGLPDMVYSANQFFYYRGKVVFSQMAHSERSKEVDYFRPFFNEHLSIEVDHIFEGGGDLVCCEQSGRLFGGHGHRTNPLVYKRIAAFFEAPIVELELLDPHFYHLDTCLCIVNQDLALVVKRAFTDEGLGLLQDHFKKLIAIDENEATEFLACNAFSPNGKDVLIESGALKLKQQLLSEGLNPILIDTSEFLKGGGSIFCLKNYLHPKFEKI